MLCYGVMSPKVEADNRGVAEGEDGYFRGTTGLPVGLHLSERVKELTRGQQTPTTAKPKTVPDFPIATR